MPLKAHAGKAGSQSGSVVVVLVDGQLVVPWRVVDDVVVVVAQPLGVQASQQLTACPTHSDPPLGGRHFVASPLIEQVVTLFPVVRQQVTNPGLPQVECEAHFFT